MRRPPEAGEMADSEIISETSTNTSAVEVLLKKVDDQSKLLQKLHDEVTAIRSTIPGAEIAAGLPNLTISPLSNAASYRELWQSRILKYKVNDDVDGLLKAFAWTKGLTLDQLLSPQRPWNRWQYQLSYPRLSAFLQDASQDHFSRSQVINEDLNERGKVSRWESKKGILDQDSLWKSISTRSESRRNTSSITSLKAAPDGQTDLSALSRNMRVLDLSPMVAAMILGATPRLNLSSTAPFLERHLSFLNYAQATLFGMKASPGKFTNAFVFEYHFAFYFVPKGAMDPELAVKDFRDLRRSSAFGPMLNDRSKWIYEEQLSILLMGQGSDVFTAYQLAERYFRGPYIQGTGHASLFINPDNSGWTPCGMFLSWILMALHHVRFRWQGAIEAIDHQLASPSDIIFSKEDPDLLSDDPQFSKSKTYFWALQAYKMFDERLEQTINTWVEFRKDSLHKLNDGRMSDETWDFTVASIDASIDKLRQKLRHIREKSQEVRNLREGLFGASALFDSRTTVRQGDNIRLLTYITLIFLPLSFCTSIFGMQVVLPSLPIKVFIITMPSIFVATAVLVFNLQNIIDAWEYIASQCTLAIRRHMRRRQGWTNTARRLHYDKITNQTRNRRSNRHSTHWSYAIYGIEALIIHIPVNEVNWFLSSLRRLSHAIHPHHHHHNTSHTDPSSSTTKELSTVEKELGGGASTGDKSRAARVRAFRVAQLRHMDPRRATFKTLLHFYFILFRLFCLPLSILVISLLYILLLPLSLFHPSRPASWLGLTLHPPAGGSQGSGSSISSASGVPTGLAPTNGNPLASTTTLNPHRKMTIVSMAGSDNYFDTSISREVHPSRRRWRKAEQTVDSGLNQDISRTSTAAEGGKGDPSGVQGGGNGGKPVFRGDVFGSRDESAQGQMVRKSMEQGREDDGPGGRGEEGGQVVGRRDFGAEAEGTSGNGKAEGEGEGDVPP